jgi:asparagine synthase (glutamine-hydrolysing)
MSAICGVVGVDGRPWTTADLDGMIRALAPHGRDGGGRWAGKTGRCGVAVASALRHSTPEDTADRQPALNPDGSLLLVGDLRIDNRGDLARSLGLKDHRLTPDSAYVLASYERWGEGMLDRIIGEFALAIVDQRRGGVLLARDHVGSRPLVMHQRPGVLAFASTALALTELEGVGHALDVRHAAEVLALAYSSERTFVQGVRWLPNGTAMWVDDSGVRRWKWWNPDPHAVVDLGSPEAYAEELREAFDLAVAARLRSSGPVGAGVSGGLDSTSVAATAAGLLSPSPLRTYTSAPLPGWHAGERPGWDADETHLVRAMVDKHPNMVPTTIHVPHDSNVLGLQEPLWQLGAGPTRNPCNMLWMFRMRAQASDDGVAILLHADLGNYFLSADGPAWLAKLLRSGRISSFLREAAAWRSSTAQNWYGTLRSQILPHLLPSQVLRLGRGMLQRSEPLDVWLGATALRPTVAAELELPHIVPHLDERLSRDGREVDLSMPAHHAGQADVVAALGTATGVESRDPTADRRVIETSMRQPEWARRYKGITRAVVRRAMADRLPPAILHRTRRGEQLPDWLDVLTAARKDISAELAELEDHAISQHLVDVERMRDLLKRWPVRTARANPEVVRDYRHALLRSLVVSRYLRWFETRATHAKRGGQERSGSPQTGL